jgi:hypothetical protein
MTAEEINAAMTPNGGWTKSRLEEWGISWPPPKGWKTSLIAQAGEAGTAETTQIGSVHEQAVGNADAPKCK